MLGRTRFLEIRTKIFHRMITAAEQPTSCCFYPVYRFLNNNEINELEDDAFADLTLKDM